MTADKSSFIVFDAWYWIQLVLFRFLVYLFRWTLAIYYWNKGKTVPPIRNPLLLKSAKNLAEDIRNGKLKSKDLIQAYIDRIQEVEPIINAVVENRFEEALKEAAEVDELIQSGKFSKQQLENEKPLLGVPFTVKMILKVKGLHCTAGSRLFKDLVAEEDAPCVALVKNAGGIVLATTNMPEFGLALQSNNPLYGQTCNPYDTTKTSGGSSGGESAILAAGASAVGIGNDIGGSVRIPAHFTGIYGHKTTRDLIPQGGTFPALHPKQEKFVTAGPMCRFAEDLVMMTKILTKGNEKVLKFDKEIDFKKLKIFYLTSIRDPKILPVDNEIMEGVYKAISHFTTSYGAKAQELKIPVIEEANDICFHLIQDSVENIADFLTAGKVPELNTVSELLKLLIGKSNFSLQTICTLHVLTSPLISKRENIPYYYKTLKILTEEFDNHLDDNSVVICPTFPKTAPYHYEMLSVLGLSYTSVCNLTGMPATAIPIGLNRHGLPQGIQIMAQKNNDPLTLACAVELNKIFAGWIPPGK